MNNLALRDKNIDEQMSLMINNRLIFCYGSDERSETEIINLYVKLLLEIKKIPTFQAVLERVRTFNWDVFYDAACMKYDYTYGSSSNFEYEGAAEEIHDTASEMEDDYNDSDNANLEFFVEFILKKNMLACEIEVQDNIFHEEGMIAVRHIRDVRIIAHDCQNVLFPDFIEHGIAGYGDFVNYYGIDNDENTLLLGDGR